MSDWVKGDGARIEIIFTLPLIGDVTEKQSYFTVTVQEYDMVPGGVLSSTVKAITSTAPKTETDNFGIILEMEPLERFNSSVGNIIVHYDGSGGISGANGLVNQFTVDFAPQDLVPKPNQNDLENISLSSISAETSLIKIYYTNVENQEQGHISISSITAVCNLIKVDDL